MECGKLTAKLRDAVPVCFMVDGKEVKRFKNIEIPDEIKQLPFIDFKFDVPATGAITFTPPEADSTLNPMPPNFPLVSSTSDSSGSGGRNALCGSSDCNI